MKRFFGMLSGALGADLFFHIAKAEAFGIQVETMAGRLGAVAFGIGVLLVLMAVVRRVFQRAFFNGFVVAVGLFLSFDIVVFHWVFGLHRITSGPEANVLEPIFVVAGCLLLWYGIAQERQKARKTHAERTLGA